jgi:hypothetical protein
MSKLALFFPVSLFPELHCGRQTLRGSLREIEDVVKAVAAQYN